MGLLDFLTDFGLSDEDKYNFNLKINEFEKLNPDIKVYREDKVKPCPFTLMYEDKFGNRYAEFYRNDFSRQAKFRELNIYKESGQIGYIGLSYLDFYFPSKK